MPDRPLKFDTLQVHGGSQPDPATGARQTPIYQTTAFVFRDAEHAASLFNLQEFGNIYSRLTNPTVGVLQNRIAALEGGVGAVGCSSGHAAQIMALFPLMRPGDNLIASSRLYGGTVTQFSNSIRRFGWSARFIDTEDPSQIAAAADENTRALFCESICNPGGYVTDIPVMAAAANELGIPLIVDNTSASPYLCRPIEQGAHIVVHSATKYLSGNGTSVGGLVVDSGKFDWSASDKFPSLSQPEPAYHGLNFHQTFGEMAYTVHGIAVGLRDLGMTMAPQNAFYILLGMETLSLRMRQHVANAKRVAHWLENDPRVASVSYCSLDSSPYRERASRLYPNGAGALMTFALKGGYDACVETVNSLDLLSMVANLGDAKSLVIHPASTTHRQLSPEQQSAAGVGADSVRLSVGIEDAEDIIADLDQAIPAA